MYMEVSAMNEKILKILNDMDPYMPEGSLIEFLYEHRSLFQFKLILSQADLDKDIEELDLSVRSNNCLRRAGYMTVGALAKAIEAKPEITSRRQLLRLRNLGRNSAQEIMLSLFCYQLRCMPERERKQYLKDMVQDNAA